MSESKRDDNWEGGKGMERGGGGGGKKDSTQGSRLLSG